MIRIRTLPLAITLCTAVAAQAQSVSIPPGAEAAVNTIVKEARATWEANQQWSRQSNDFATEHPDLAPPDAAIIEALARKLHAHPAVDAYVKWQLLGYLSDGALADADRRSIRRVLATLPPVGQLPPPDALRREGQVRRADELVQWDRRMPWVAPARPVAPPGVGSGRTIAYRPEIGVLNDGITLDVEGTVSRDGRYVTMTVRAAAAQIESIRAFRVVANQPITQFRQALAAQLDDGPELLDLLFQDARDRIRAGDPGHRKAVERFVAAARRLSRSRDLSMPMRRALIERVDSLGREQRYVIRHIDLADEGCKVAYDTPAFAPDLLQQAKAALRGEVAE